MSPNRLPEGGRIDRSRTILFRFDNREMRGHPGDTLASALIANGVRLVGRSFKYHRARGIFSAGPEEPNALVELREGARREANTRATTVELFDGLTARSQNRWPTLERDVGAINQSASKLLTAGFYYKTFMWPSPAWETVYEPAIRRMAGLGRASRDADPDTYEHRHAHCDVLVVGSGPAGLAAAREAALQGARVILCEQDFEAGGSLLSDPAAWPALARDLGEIAKLPDLKLLTRTTVVGFHEHNVLGAVERVADHVAVPSPDEVRQRFWTIRARQVVLATGAIERLIAFPGNDRPGVMLSGAARTFAGRFAALPGRRAVLFTTHDGAYRDAHALAALGVEIAAIVDVRADSKALFEAKATGLNVMPSTVVVGTSGSHGIESVRVRARNGSGAEETVLCDLLMISGGYGPAINLSAQTRAKPAYRLDVDAFVPGEPTQAERSPGSARGLFGLEAARSDGARAGRAAAAAAGLAAKPDAAPIPEPAPEPLAIEPFPDVEAKGKAFVDLQNDATADDIRLAHREGFSNVEHMKRYTTHGMATDQGKTGGFVGTAILAKARGESLDKVGLTTFRPYVTPVTIGAIAGPAVGPDFMPRRLSPFHDWHARKGGVFMETGLWYRPLYYTLTGETGWDPILKEARAVRSGVGLCDVSTLGKIDVAGPDAVTFLERIYASPIASIKVGRARYGIMLREDGHVYDDGTITRLAPDRFLITTTTAKAAEVMEHMEGHAQTVWPELDVTMASVTDQWAQVSLAGPRARDVLKGCVTGIDLTNEAFPFMAFGEGVIAGVPVRIFRVSFSGELAYEVACPAGYAERVADAILKAGAPFDISLYGLEALTLLRVEKGHVAGPELNGQTTARDLGLTRLLKKSGDYIGRAMAERPAMADLSRPRLVGIRAPSSLSEPRLRAGAHILSSRESRESLGHVTSVTRSVELNRWVGLALVRDGEARIGQRLIAGFPLKDEYPEVEITEPHHVDPENARVRA